MPVDFPSTPATGETYTSGDRTWKYNGTAWDAFTSTSSGLTLIKAQTVGSAVSSVTLTSVFSATYDSYRITMNYVLSSATDPGIYVTLGSTATGYYGATAYWAYDTSGDGTAKRNNGTEWNWGYFGVNQTSASWDILYPFKTNRTGYNGQYSGDLYMGSTSGWLGNNTSYTDIKFAPATGTLTGGVIRVYGYSNS